MAHTPQWKVYDGNGKYMAACRDVIAACVLVGFYGNDATVRHRHGRILWREGSEEHPAGESYDDAAELIEWRLNARLNGGSRWATFPLLPVGTVVKRTEEWHHRKRMARGGGWSDRERTLHKQWEEAERAELWTVAEHLRNESGPYYRLTQGARTATSTPYDWEAA